MTPGEFQEAKRIYNSAVERPPAQRQAYVAGACAGNEALRNEVESLLACRSEADDFFQTPAFEGGAMALARESSIDLTGRTLSHYEILEKLGEGGMGVVYRARDTHLDRLTALKVLSPDKVTDPDRRRRFVQEAKAASALNHPNIVTIHDIDSAEGVTFIAMELVIGKTLDRLLRGKGIELREMLRAGVQIADALTAAHRAGIVHRDIKPANILVTDSGLIKVLDFGLAKLIGPEERPQGQKTEAGIVLGTVAYMSPEQAEGKDVDSRSDIFSFGSLMYEMTTGRRPFSGDSNASTIAAILREEPTPVSQVAPGTPAELERVIGRCLRKDRERRFQHIADVKVALEELEEESSVGSEPRTGSPRSRWRRRLAWTAVSLLLTAAIGLGARFAFVSRVSPVARESLFAGLPGVQTHPALSPDGKQVAFVWDGEKQDNYDIYVQLAGETAPRRLTSSPALEYSPVWSPDALHIAFLRETPTGTKIVIIPAAGGTEQLLHVSQARCHSTPQTMAKQYCGVAWSPNGRFLTMVDKEAPAAPNSIFLYDIQTREHRKLTTPPRGFEDGFSVFSPDGRTLAFARRPGLPLSDIYVLPLSDSGEPRAKPRRLTQDNAFIVGMDWTPNGRAIVFSSSRGGVFALWRVASFGGVPERLPVGGSDAYWPSVSRTGGRLAYGTGTADLNIWRVAAPGAGVTGPAAAPLRITHSPLIDMEPTFAPDGTKIAWASLHSGSHQIWVSNNDGSRPIRLTDMDTPGADAPQWSPDGRQLAFRGFSPPPRRVYVISANGGVPRRLTTGDFVEGTPTWSHDGKWIYFSSNRGEGAHIWKAPSSGGSPALIAPNGNLPVESFDGKFVYYTGRGGSIWKAPSGGGVPVLLAAGGSWPIESFDRGFVFYRGPGTSIWKVPAGGGEAVQAMKTGERAFWTLGRSGIYTLDPDAKGGPTIEFFPFAAKAREAVRLPGVPDSYVMDEPGYGPVVSRDGRWILYHQFERTQANIMLVDNFR